MRAKLALLGYIPPIYVVGVAIGSIVWVVRNLPFINVMSGGMSYSEVIGWPSHLCKRYEEDRFDRMLAKRRRQYRTDGRIHTTR